MHVLSQAAWEEVEQTFAELTETRLRVKQLKSQLDARKTEAEHEVSSIAEELHNDTMAL